MNTIIAPSNTVTMSSREIADLTGKQHHHVVRDIRRDLVALGTDPSRFGCIYLDGANRKQTEYMLTNDLVMTVLTGYSVPLGHRVVTRLVELENVSRHAVTMPSNFAEALQLAADQARQNTNLQLVIQQQAPKVQALDLLSKTEGSVCITTAAKQLGVGPLKLFGWMSANRWIYRRSTFAPWSAYQPRLSAGVLEHKLVRVGKGGDEDDVKVVEQVMVTRLGITTLAEQIQGNPL